MRRVQVMDMGGLPWGRGTNAAGPGRYAGVVPTRRELLVASGGALTLGALGAAAWVGPVGAGPSTVGPPGEDIPTPSTRPVAVKPPLTGPLERWPTGTVAGMNLAHLHARGRGYGSEPCRARLARLAALGCTTVALTPFAYQKGVDDVALVTGGDRSLTREDLVQCAADARALGLEVVLKPHVWCREFWTAGASRQDLRPDPARGGWGAWFASYTAWLEDMAALATELQASLLVVGLEYLRATVDNPGAWADVAAAARRHYAGPLSYAANWWRELELFADWAAFDVVGVNAYPPLDAPAEVAALAEAWAPHLGLMGAVAQRTGKGLLMLEAGVPAVAGAQAEPWNAGWPGEPAPALPGIHAEALLRAALPQPWFRGVLFWKWFTDDPSRGPGRERDPYALAGGPAEAVLRRWWRP